MSSSRTPLKENQHITPPLSFVDPPLTPPPTDEKTFTQAPRVIALFKDIEAGKSVKQPPWTVLQLARGEYDEIERRLEQDELLCGYVKDKIRYDYDGNKNRLVVRMPTAVHELFIARVEDTIFSQLKSIREGLSDAAAFAQKVQPARSTEIYFPVDDAPPGTRSKHEPDASFWHTDARYPGVIIEVAYSQKRKKLGRLAEDYLLDSNASVQVVVGLDIEYGKKGSRKATLLVWRTQVVSTADGDELRVVQEIADEPFRDDQGNPTDHPGLRLHLTDFAYEELAHNEIGDEDRELVVSTQQLCEYLNVAETMVGRLESLGEHSIAPGLKKRKRSETPTDQITSGDEATYVRQEERAAKRMAKDDSDYEDTSVKSSSE
ncbi:hypothetical protein K505DRAFT_366255 [Melanomma pulvis-pyrius CBS 109.77]|uniref:Uncharacterized protein n=1 Tax=Melanomma pulvis-pyrius CBS 109.77 TaxID=1314802 RepID=A0A6A6WXN6_9PLEO|nr:hypothetical protein K505DRAFT_366255 [Melanomma pulvis-pyrius CBS 109.77]